MPLLPHGESMTAERLTDEEFEEIVESCGDRHEALAKGISIGLQRAAEIARRHTAHCEGHKSPVYCTDAVAEEIDREREGGSDASE